MHMTSEFLPAFKQGLFPNLLGNVEEKILEINCEHFVISLQRVEGWQQYLLLYLPKKKRDAHQWE